MDARAVMRMLRRHGVALVPDGDWLRYCPKGTVTPALEGALRRHKWAILALLLADDPEVRWRLAAMRARLPTRGPLPFLTARDVPRGARGCLSCGDPLPPMSGDALAVRCRPCAHAARLVLMERSR